MPLPFVNEDSVPMYALHAPFSSCEPLLCIQCVKVPLSLMSVCFTTLDTNI